MEKMIPDDIKFVLNTLTDAGFEAYLIGGCTRDFLLGLPIHDFDITTSARPEEVMVLFQAYDQFHAGVKHGTVSLVIAREVIEVTSFRLDGPYSDSRHPDAVSFTRSLREDVARRDFTINGIAYGLAEGFVDFYGGRADLEKGLIRAIGQPDQRFAEDGLRIFRGVRFSATLAFAIEPATYASMVKNLSRLDAVSAERKAVELSKAVLGKDIQTALCQYTDVFAQIIPELGEMKGFDQRNVYHIYDVLTHTAICVQECPLDLSIRLAALLHDTGKVSTYTEEDGVGHFYGHSAISAEIARRVMAELRFSNEIKQEVTMLVQNHDRQIEARPKAVRRALCQMGEDLFFKLLALQRADQIAQNPAYFYRIDHLRIVQKIAEEILAQDQCFSLKNLAVDGRDLMALGLQGPEIGRTLALCLEAVLEEEVPNQKEALIQFVREAKKISL